jgi:hypothetical protein
MQDGRLAAVTVAPWHARTIVRRDGAAALKSMSCTHLASSTPSSSPRIPLFDQAILGVLLNVSAEAQ